MTCCVLVLADAVAALPSCSRCAGPCVCLVEPFGVDMQANPSYRVIAEFEAQLPRPDAASKGLTAARPLKIKVNTRWLAHVEQAVSS